MVINRMGEEVNRDTVMAVMANDMLYVKQHLDSIDQKISSSYVTKQEIARINDRVKLLERFMYGAITFLLLGIGYAVLNVIGLSR